VSRASLRNGGYGGLTDGFGSTCDSRLDRLSWGESCRSDARSQFDSTINFHPARAEKIQEAQAAVTQRLLDAQQRGILAMTPGPARYDQIPYARKSAQGVLSVIVVPRHAVVVEKSEEPVAVFFESFLERRSSLGCAFHRNDLFDEFYGGLLVFV
jgi:plasmid stabilization system protein ParE